MSPSGWCDRLPGNMASSLRVHHRSTLARCLLEMFFCPFPPSPPLTGHLTPGVHPGSFSLPYQIGPFGDRVLFSFRYISVNGSPRCPSLLQRKLLSCVPDHSLREKAYPYFQPEYPSSLTIFFFVERLLCDFLLSLFPPRAF